MNPAEVTATLPLWQLLLAPAVALVGVLLGHLLTRGSAKELDKRWHREETMRTLRWACEQTGSDREGLRFVGFAVLGALSASSLLQEEDRRFIDAVASAAVEAPATEYGEGTGFDAVDVVDEGLEGSSGQAAASHP